MWQLEVMAVKAKLRVAAVVVEVKSNLWLYSKRIPLQHLVELQGGSLRRFHHNQLLFVKKLSDELSLASW